MKKAVFLAILLSCMHINSQDFQFEGYGRLVTPKKLKNCNTIEEVINQIMALGKEIITLTSEYHGESFEYFLGSDAIYFKKKGKYSGISYYKMYYKSIKVDKYGYNVFWFNNERYPVIFGPGIAFGDTNADVGLWEQLLSVMKGTLFEDYTDPARLRYAIYDDGVKNISAWSTLVEKKGNDKIEYSACRMRFPFVQEFISDEARFVFNNSFGAWAEGENGAGIGGSIDIEFSRKTNVFYILNGYIDLNKPDLYKKNNRLKTIIIEDAETKKTIREFEFVDIVEISSIILPYEVSKIRIIIKNVYKGTEYDDTCISKIFLPQIPIREKRLVLEEIRKILRKDGISYE